MRFYYLYSLFLFSSDSATTEIYTLSLHDALPICLDHKSDPRVLPTTIAIARSDRDEGVQREAIEGLGDMKEPGLRAVIEDRKSTRLNSSHLGISYAVFCLKKKKKKHNNVT